MNTIFLNSENSKATDAHKLRFNITGKIDLQRGDKCTATFDVVKYKPKNINIIIL